MYRLLTACLTLAAATATAAEPAGTLTKFRSERGRFAVEVPGTPKKETFERETPDGAVTFTAYAVESGTRAFVVTYADLPAEAVTDPEELLDGTRPNEETFDVFASKALTVCGDIPGREYLGRTRDGYYLRLRVYVDGGRLYTLVVGDASEAGVTGRDAERFFKSFRVTGRID